jgi:hypothetical protein
MGRIRVPSLCFSIDTLRAEVAKFHEFTRDSNWMVADNHEKRRAVVEGLTFVMLNLAEDVDQEVVWELFHQAMDEYHKVCEQKNLQF